jgi:hypothetical protein
MKRSAKSGRAADQYRAQKIAQHEAERLGLNVEPLRAVPRQKECS